MKLYPLLRATLLLLLLIASATANSQTFSFDVRNSKTADTYNVAIDLTDKTINAAQGNSSVFSHSFASATVLDRGIAFSFVQGQTPSLDATLDDWFFAIKPTSIGFNNPDSETFVLAKPINSSSFTSTYNSLVAAISGTTSSNTPSGSTRTYTVNGVSFTMVYVPGGTFSMGGTSEQGSDAYDREGPVHLVTLSDYSIGQTEVTQELWMAVMDENPSSFNAPKRPVENVPYEDCDIFITMLNNITGENFRLPTEAEWEYAARGGRSGGTKYAGSNNIDDVAWFYDNSGQATHEVATKKPNSLGIYDMSGNVWEWTSDVYGDYTADSQTDPLGASDGSNIVIRGGAWGYDARSCRVSLRFSVDIENAFGDLGFRLAL